MSSLVLTIHNFEVPNFNGLINCQYCDDCITVNDSGYILTVNTHHYWIHIIGYILSELENGHGNSGFSHEIDDKHGGFFHSDFDVDL